MAMNRFSLFPGRGLPGIPGKVGGGGGAANSPANPGQAPACGVAGSAASQARKNLQKPFVVASNSVLAAGAVAAGGTVHSNFLAANVDFIATDNTFPYDVQTFGIITMISSNLAATYIEQVAILANLFWIESDQTGELARWPVLSTGLIISTEGSITSGAVAHSAYYGPEVFQQWDRYYANGTTQTLILAPTFAFTSVGPINVGVSMPAKR